MTTVLIPPPPKSAREKFLDAVEALLGQPVVWGALDCSETVAIGVEAASDGKLKQRATHRAQTYHDETRPLLPTERAIPGDLIFWGSLPVDVTKNGPSIIHVGVIMKNGKVLSADGATSRITDAKVAALNPNAKVALHDTPHFRRDPYVSVHRNTIVDSIEFVSR